MEIYVFDKNLSILGVIDKYESLIWNRRSSEVGEFELHRNIEKETLDLLKEENIICKSNDLTECAYIENIYLDEDSKGIETIKVTGRFVTGYIGRRIIWNKETINDTVENAIRRLVNKNCINTTEERVIPFLRLGESKNYVERINYQVSYKNLEDEVSKLSNEKDLNFRTITDIQNKIHYFDIYKGVDRTVNQNINSICIFSRDFENIYEQSYSSENNDLKNIALIGGEGEGKERIFSTIGEGKGLQRHELFVDADDIRSTKEDETSIPEDEYMKLLNQRGLEKLDEYKRVDTFESKINVTNSNLIYRKDFDLGDYVTCLNKKWGVIVDVKITEIEEVYEKNGFEVNVVFGNKIPTLIDKLKRR